jgi:hypothetical protein
MRDSLDQVLQLVADGRLTPEEAAPILDALGSADEALGAAGEAIAQGEATAWAASPGDRTSAPPTALRIEVTDAGRRVVNLRIPLTVGRFALDQIPGLSGSNADLIRQALAEGRTGTLLAIDDEDDGVRVVLE